MKRGCLDRALLGAVLLLAFGASSYFWFTFFVRGKSIPTPNLVGRRITDARNLCSDLGLIMLVDEKKNRKSDKVKAGDVAWQNRTAGAANYVKRGTRIFVGLSEGPLVLTVPDLLKQTQRTAVLRLGQRSLRVGNVAYFDTPGAQNILAVDPPVDTVVPPGSQVSLLIGYPPVPPAFVMPEVIDHPLEEVRSALTSQGLAITNVRFEAYPGIRDGIIIRQFPLRGAPVTARDPITLVVSRQDEGSIIEQPAVTPPPQPQPPQP